MNTTYNYAFMMGLKSNHNPVHTDKPSIRQHIATIRLLASCGEQAFLDAPEYTIIEGYVGIIGRTHSAFSFRLHRLMLSSTS